MPERRHRAVTRKMVLASVLFGVLLAVASVPVADLAFERLSSGWGEPMLVWSYEMDGHRAVVFRHGAGPGVRWWVLSGPDGSTFMRAAREIDAGAVVTRTDPRPSAIRWPLGVGDREARYVEVGWPLRSASRGRIWARAAGARDEWGVFKAKVLGHEVSLSTRPIWPGLLGNVLFYALLVLTPIALWRWRRLRRRARRGLCVACGYELGDGVDVCPECGLAAASRVAGGPARGAPDRS